MDEEQPALFGGLSDQAAPRTLYADAHVLEPCDRCLGLGREDPPDGWPAWRRALWEPKCARCRGAGRVVRYVGRCVSG
jgi:hypothetical protein